MPDSSPTLALPYIQPNQAQKHVTHNEALVRLDLLAQLAVVRFGAQTPPPSPGEGEAHALGSGLSGAWAGQAGKLAQWRDGAWHFTQPRAGWRAWGQTEGELRIWDGAAWVLPPADYENLDGLGIATAPDAVNRLSVVSGATLLSHAGAGHQLKINKATGGDTAALLFQSDWTGHAEMGLAGDTDFSIKVSDDGSGWTEALAFDGASGIARGAAVQSGSHDATTGRLMAVGAFGLGAGLEMQALVIADDAAGTLTPPRQGGFALITCAGDDAAPQAGFSGMIWYGTGPTPEIHENTGWATGPGANFAVSAGDVTGTDGAPGTVTAAARTGALKIENRSGAARSFQVSFL